MHIKLRSSNALSTLCSVGEVLFFLLFSQTSLAVGDTEEVQKEAQLQKLALQVSTCIHVHVSTKGAVASV